MDPIKEAMIRHEDENGPPDERARPAKSYIILVRNPSNGTLIAIANGEGGDANDIAEFETEQEATDAANLIPACKSWGYQIVGTN